MHQVLAYSIGVITSSVDKVDLRPALREFPELKGDYSKILRPTGAVDLLLGIRDARLHPYLANPSKHCRGDLRLLTSKFGSGYLLDGSHSDIKVEPLHVSPGATERSRGSFTFVTRRGFKRRPKVSHGISQVDTSGLLEGKELANSEAEPNPLYKPSSKSMRKAKALEKAAKRADAKKESPEQARVAA